MPKISVAINDLTQAVSIRDEKIADLEKKAANLGAELKNGLYNVYTCTLVVLS